MSAIPKTLAEAIRVYADEETAFELVRTMRWPDGTTCPHCGSDSYSFISTRRIWKCRDCKKQYSVKVGTIFEDSPIKLGTWLTAVWLITNAKNGISSHEISRALGITQKTAWFMLHRIRLAMAQGSFIKLGGEVEVDETFIGGKRGNMHKARQAKIRHGGLEGKTAVMGILERDGSVLAAVVPNTRTRTLLPHIMERVEPGSTVYTDASNSYQRLSRPGYFEHKVIDHQVAYADGDTHVNGIENFWSLFKRCLKGTYIHVNPEHLNSYVDEQTFRFNNRKTNDGERFAAAVSKVGGKRIMYRDLIARGNG